MGSLSLTPYSSNSPTPVPLGHSRCQYGVAGSPLTHRRNSSVVVGNHLHEAQNILKAVAKGGLPDEMPIGSLTLLQQPPDAGVMKISNIPYSITKQEILQFVGRQSRLSSGQAVHIIMERSTAKTMDCYVEFATPGDAKETVKRIDRIQETGRPPRLGNRHVDVEISSQDALLRDLFPRAKCVHWQAGMPTVLRNNDPYSTGFAGFFTSEEIIGAIRHAEMPHRSPFSTKCPQRTYESTISTLYKFPWYAVDLYTVHDRNLLFDLVNRQVMALLTRMSRANTVGLDQHLLNDLLRSGLECPGFNERQRYTLCVNAENFAELNKLSDISRWFPFDTLATMPNIDEHTYKVCFIVDLISKGSIHAMSHPELPNNFPSDNVSLISPFGPIWFEWPEEVAKRTLWQDAVSHETNILFDLLSSGSRNPHGRKLSFGSHSTRSSVMSPDTDSLSQYDVFSPPPRRASDSWHMRAYSYSGIEDNPWNSRLLLHSDGRGRNGFPGHRFTRSSPVNVPVFDD
ncbi:uncharacterized protein BO66DRAFT_380577 [Aspergillus aculeatinus CBS 121060]|uniref:Uncharacterized protein n=1 Tax=Aspergillus aculeatinus CBS 121060 TaxID=1448322 RepID=A0ACD1GZL3_9EURO|nr:hypothetical protein BO66DRAFT_380577 [Aspergillus aculeatinus CBS 121060]RAH66791.1 hypothetical protein BO66DRAFT_380577 [Aspergillus aculeatinus CBS 121060]